MFFNQTEEPTTPTEENNEGAEVETKEEEGGADVGAIGEPETKEGEEITE